MPLQLHEVAGHPPFAAGSFRWTMGLRSVAPSEWLQDDDRRDDDLRLKRELHEQDRSAVFGAMEGSGAAAEETAELVGAWLGERGLSLDGDGAHPLERAGRSVQEDLCLLEPRENRWVLTAGSVCFPTRWDLASKLGLSLAAIHAPVPGYAEQLAARVDRSFARMAPGALAHRLNWSVVGEPHRRLPAGPPQASSTLPADPATGLHLRIERQTLRRLHRHRAIVFGIRIHGWPLGEVIHALPPDQLATQIETMDPAVARYKNLEGMADDLIGWLRSQATPRG